MTKDYPIHRLLLLNSRRSLAARLIWSPKKGPVLTVGRLKHLLWGAGIGILARMLGWSPIVALSASCGIGYAWEMLTPILATRYGWKWPYADWIDAVAFPIGSLLTVVVR